MCRKSTNSRNERVLKSEYCKNDGISKSFVTFSPIFHSLGRYVPIYSRGDGEEMRKKGGRLLRFPAIAITRGERNTVEHLEFKNEGVDFGEVKTRVKHEL